MPRNLIESLGEARRMARKLVFNVKQVEGFSPQGLEDSYISRLLVDKESVGSKYLVVNHFVLKPGKQTPRGSHPEPYDELYYVLRGHAILRLGEPSETFGLEQDTVAFIPAGTMHTLDNIGDQDLELLTVMPHQLVEGANPLYDARIKAWGTSFRLANEE
jgi:mannose-6-phosphate isomerase-like protein (cupin superfamily)